MTTTKERPILFRGPMVRAILDGQKTQTRRVVKPRWLPLVEQVMEINGKWVWTTIEYDLTTPYGEPGERLWVRENWQAWAEFDRTAPSDIPNDALDRINYPAGGNVWDAKIRPSIHMPREASRLTLEIVDVRVERLNDISEDDARAEGVASVDVSSERALDEWCRRSAQIAAKRGESRSATATNVGKFSLLWDQINGKSHPWNSNPFVWVINFKPIEEAHALR